MKTNKSISLTDKQFKYLMILVHLGETMVNGFRGDRGGPKILKKYADLLSFINSQAKEFGMEKYIDPDPDEEENIYCNRGFDEECVDQFIEEYDEEVFWTDLPSRLADRDFDRDFDDKKVSPEERFNILCNLESRYIDEINKNDLKNIDIVSDDDFDMSVTTKAGQVGNRYRYYAVFTTPNDVLLTREQSEVIKKELEKVAKKFDSRLDVIHFSGSYWMQVTILIPSNRIPQELYDSFLDIVSSQYRLLNYHVLTGNVKKFTPEEIEVYRDEVVRQTKAKLND